MIESTESESREELDRFVDALKMVAEEASQTLSQFAQPRNRIGRLDEVKFPLPPRQNHNGR